MDNKCKNIIFMKYGVHASEGVEQIARKKNELQNAGKMLWGYGGTICHPVNQIHPFLNGNVNRNEKTYLVMAYTPSEMHKNIFAAESYSINKKKWIELPKGIHVYGSKYAIVCKSIEQCDYTVDLADYIVPIGNSCGRPLSEYVNGRIDKACGRWDGKSKERLSKPVHITLCAEIDYPYAVFLK